MISYDEQALILNAIPNFTMMDTEYLVKGTDIVQGIVDDLLTEYPDLQAGLTGFVPIGHDEMVYSEQSLGYTSLIAVVAILILLIISLRMWIAPLLAMTNLIIGIMWAVGVAAIIVGQLNIMTQMMAVILLGLGIDFSIHLISGFTERRAAGDSIAVAMETTFLNSGKGVITGALTTSFAFLTLVISSSRGMKEMGLVSGFGLLAILVSTFLILPMMLVYRERRLDRKRESKGGQAGFVQRDISFRFLGNTGQWLGKHYIFTIVTAVIITIFLLYSGSKITFDQNYMNIEPEGLTSIVLQDTVMDKFDLSMDYAMIIADDVDESRDLAKRYRDRGTVAMSEDISLYLPSAEQQQKRIPHIEDVKHAIQKSRIKPSFRAPDMPDLMKEIDRLEMNVMEMQDMAYVGGQDKVDDACKKIIGEPKVQNTINLFGQLRELIQSRQSAAPGAFSKLHRKRSLRISKNPCSKCAPPIASNWMNCRLPSSIALVTRRGINFWSLCFRPGAFGRTRNF